MFTQHYCLFHSCAVSGSVSPSLCLVPPPSDPLYDLLRGGLFFIPPQSRMWRQQRMNEEKGGVLDQPGPEKSSNGENWESYRWVLRVGLSLPLLTLSLFLQPTTCEWDFLTFSPRHLFRYWNLLGRVRTFFTFDGVFVWFLLSWWSRMSGVWFLCLHPGCSKAALLHKWLLLLPWVTGFFTNSCVQPSGLYFYFDLFISDCLNCRHRDLKTHSLCFTFSRMILISRRRSWFKFVRWQ